MARDRILFVDDEPQILQGLARMLRPMRHEWEVAFAASGDAALARLDEEAFDVVVSDMRMPGMSGAELLARVAAKHPRSVRIILSGQAREQDLIRAVNAAHQFLSKPCEPEAIKEAIRRAVAIRDLLHEPALVEAVSSMTTLPSFPAAYQEIMEIVNSDDPSLEAIAGVVARDPGMTAKILQLVNSSFFGFARAVTDVRQATFLLGVERILMLVLVQHVFRELDRAGEAGIDIDVLWHRCASLAANARRIAEAEGVSDEVAGFAQIAGLLSVAGTLVLAAGFPDRYRLALQANGHTVASEAAEVEQFGATSSQVGAYLLGLWGLPPAVVEAVAFFRTPGAVPSSSGVRPVMVLHIAAALDPAYEPPLELDVEYLAQLGLAHRVAHWQQTLQEMAA